MLEHNDSYSLFAALGDPVVVGPSGTNDTDIHAVLRLKW